MDGEGTKFLFRPSKQLNRASSRRANPENPMKINPSRSVTSIIAASVCFAAAIATPTFSAAAADQAPPNLFPNPLDFIGNLSRLNLSQKQMDDIQKLLKDRMPKVELLMTRAMEAERALRAAINAEPLDEKAVRRKSEDLGAVITDCAVEAARLRSDVMELLTKEQREACLALHKSIEQMETTASRFVDMLRLLARMAQMGQMPQFPQAPR
jgi:Spy/CpxP family protein refolding chaperone